MSDWLPGDPNPSAGHGCLWYFYIVLGIILVIITLALIDTLTKIGNNYFYINI
jgi:hypothetical protein